MIPSSLASLLLLLKLSFILVHFSAQNGLRILELSPKKLTSRLLLYLSLYMKPYLRWNGFRPAFQRYARNVHQTTMMQRRHAHRAAVALGSNMGDRIRNIEDALAEMRKTVSVLKVSPLYETKPMYYEDQDRFINGACEVETDLDPIGLLDVLQDIENDLGRKRTIEKGPRPIDLDVILYDQQQFFHERLEVPHKLMHEREFVLRPLSEYAMPFVPLNLADLYVVLRRTLSSAQRAWTMTPTRL